MTEQERADALKSITSIIIRCERAQPKFTLGSSQHTLLKNRIQAMKIAETLLTEGDAALYTAQDLSAALEPLASAIRKCEKAQVKYEPDSGQHRRFNGIIQAMALSRELIENELLRRAL